MKKRGTDQFWKTFKKFLNKFWFIAWKDDSFKGWLISILFIFILIKFIFLPTLSFATGTALPLAIVESCSMYHDGNLLSDFDAWWQRHESVYSPQTINDLDFQDFIFKNGFNKGDILFVIRANPEKLKVGDVIIFNGGSNHPIIHRIIKIEEKSGEKIFSTMGDNVGRIQFFEQEIKSEQLVGKAVFKLAPYLGWGKLIFFDWKNDESKRGFCEEN
jgi:signal peptidase I